VGIFGQQAIPMAITLLVFWPVHEKGVSDHRALAPLEGKCQG